MKNTVVELLEDALRRAGLALIYNGDLGQLEFVSVTPARKWGHMIFRNEVDVIDTEEGWAKSENRGLASVDFQLPGGAWMQITAKGGGRLQVSTIEKPEDAPL